MLTGIVFWPTTIRAQAPAQPLTPQPQPVRLPVSSELTSQTLALRTAIRTLDASVQTPDTDKVKVKTDTVAAMEQAISHMGNGTVAVAAFERSLILYQSL